MLTWLMGILLWKSDWRKTAAVSLCFLFDRDDQVCADGESARSNPTVQVLPASRAQQEVPARGRRGALLPEPQKRPGGGPSLLIFYWFYSGWDVDVFIMQMWHHCGVCSNCLVSSVRLWSTKTLSWSTVSTPLCSSWLQSQRTRSVPHKVWRPSLKMWWHTETHNMKHDPKLLL